MTFSPMSASRLWKRTRSSGSRPAVGSSTMMSLGSAEQRLRDAEALAHAAGETAERLLAHVVEVGLLQQRRDDVAPLRLVGEALEPREVVEQLFRGDLGIDAEVLRQVAERSVRTASLSRSTSRSPSRAVPASASCSVASVRISVDLPAPFGPEQTEHAGRDRERDVGQRLHPVGVGLGQAGDFELEGHGVFLDGTARSMRLACAKRQLPGADAAGADEMRSAADGLAPSWPSCVSARAATRCRRPAAPQRAADDRRVAKAHIGRLAAGAPRLRLRGSPRVNHGSRAITRPSCAIADVMPGVGRAQHRPSRLQRAHLRDLVVLLSGDRAAVPRVVGDVDDSVALARLRPDVRAERVLVADVHGDALPRDVERRRGRRRPPPGRRAGSRARGMNQPNTPSSGIVSPNGTRWRLR